MNGACPFRIFCFATSIGNHRALSTSGNCACRPDFGGAFHGEHIALERGWVEVAADGPGEDKLAAWLLERLEPQELALGRVAHFFLELSPSCGQRLLIVRDLALRNGPRPVVFFGPIGSARVREEHLDASRASGRFPEEQQSRAFSWQGSPRSGSGRRRRFRVQSLLLTPEQRLPSRTPRAPTRCDRPAERRPGDGRRRGRSRGSGRDRPRAP